MDATVGALGSSLPCDDERAHGVAFAIAHDAADYCFALVDWFARENEIHQRLLSAPRERPSEVAPHPDPAIGCVWELEVTDFERRAWLRHVLANLAAQASTPTWRAISRGSYKRAGDDGRTAGGVRRRLAAQGPRCPRLLPLEA